MSRDLTSSMIAQVGANGLTPFIMLDLALASGAAHVWSGVGPVTWNGNMYQGVGNFGAMGDVKESLDVRADGTSVTLSGIDSTLLNDCLNDIQIGAAATIWIGALLANGTIVDSPYQIFTGTVDRPVLSIGPKTMSITLALETKIANLQRGNGRRYTSADQRIYYPDDIGFHWVELQNDIALRWG